MTTLLDLITDLKTLDPDLPLVFVTDAGEIGGGYHVTELKRAQISSIDCGGDLSDWIETTLQLLDGSGRSHMSVGKFITIAERSIAAIQGLSDGPLSFEYSPQNIGLHRYQASEITIHRHKIQLNLTEDRATCKPNQKFADAATTSGCCGVSENSPPPPAAPNNKQTACILTCKRQHPPDVTDLHNQPSGPSFQTLGS